MDKPLVYFDSCIWIAMITGEQRPDIAETHAIAGLVSQLDNEQIIAVSSIIMKAEVLDADFDNAQKTLFENIIKRGTTVQLKEVNDEIIDLTAEIRNFYKNVKNTNPRAINPPSLPDAIHLACEFLTVDKGLLKLNSPIMGKHNIKISKPQL